MTPIPSVPMSMGARISPERHSKLPWRITEIAPDFELVDAWLLPASGTLAEFADLCKIFASLDIGQPGSGSGASTALFKSREWLGRRLGWDDEINTLPIPGCAESSLRDRMTEDLAPAPPDGPAPRSFLPVFRTPTETAFELSNGLLHAIMHLGWVDDGAGIYHGQMGVYVKHRVRRSVWYMRAIAPFRHVIVYPGLLRLVDRQWQARH